MATLSIIGECMVELSGAPFSHEITQTYGGDTLNTAVYLSRLLPDHVINYVTGVGKDTISDALLQAWETEGIDTRFVLRFDRETLGLYWILLNEEGERSFMYWRKDSAASKWLAHEESCAVLEGIQQSDWIYLSGISFAILSQTHREQLLNWLRSYKQAGGKIAFDSNYRPRLWSSKEEMQSFYHTIMTLTDLALLTIEDEAGIWGIEESEVLAHLKQFTSSLIILKQGRDGALIIEPESARLIPSDKIDRVIDTTAAGDSFNAGVLAGIIQNFSIEDACRLGHKIAGTVIQHKGAIIPKECMPG